MSDRELHRRRRGRNVALAIVLLGLVALVFVVSLTKMRMGAEQKRAMDPARQETVLPTKEGTKQ